MVSSIGEVWEPIKALDGLVDTHVGIDVPSLN
jgi:hypothetical protein